MDLDKIAKAVLETSQLTGAPICDVVEAACDPEVYDQVMSLCEEMVLIESENVN